MIKRRMGKQKNMRSAVLVFAAGCFALFALLSLMVFPMKVWNEQQGQKESAEQEIVQLKNEIVSLDHELRLLETDQGVERKARKDLGLVFPGEESYRITASE